jgi:hypothetical protein
VSLEVTQMLTPGSVWAYSPWNSGFLVLSPMYCAHQLVDPSASYTKIDEASTKVDTCQLPFPHQHCWNGMAG